MKLIFCMLINIKLSYRLILLIFVGMARHAQITQNNKFGISFWYLKKKVRVEVEFLCRWASKFSTNWCNHCWWAWPGMPKILKITSMQYLCNISKKNWGMQLMFCMTINKKVFYRLILLFLIGLVRHVQSNQASLQCLFDIWRKMLGVKLGTLVH